MNKIKIFFLSRPLKRFYRVTGFGFLSLFLTNLTTLTTELSIEPTSRLLIITILTAIITALDKYKRDSRTDKKK